MERSQFTFYRSFMAGISRIRNKSARCDAYDAVIRFALDGTEPDTDAMPDAAAMAFIMAKPALESGRKKAEAGQKGGESKPQASDKQTASKAEANRKLDIDIDIDIEQMLKGEKPQRGQYQDIIDAWNALGLTTVKKVASNSTRHRLLTARVSEYGQADIIKAINSVKDSAFLRGDNDRGWVITFDWLLKPSNFQKVLEGNYIDRKKPGKYDPMYIGDHSKPILNSKGQTLYEQMLEEEQQLEEEQEVGA